LAGRPKVATPHAHELDALVLKGGYVNLPLFCDADGSRMIAGKPCFLDKTHRGTVAETASTGIPL
jgi:hypothetical protein